MMRAHRIPNSQPGRKAMSLAALRCLLADIVESSDDAIFSRKLDGTISSWNAACETIFGYSAREIVGRSGTVLLPLDRPDEVRQLMERVQKGERVKHFETVRLRKGGKRIVLSLSASPIRDARGRIVGAATIARDITGEREMEARILEMSECERQCLGRDLHDGLGQQLGGTELLCRTLLKALRQRRCPEARTAQVLVEQMQKALAQTRALARGLTPVLDRPNGLMLALEDFCANTCSLCSIQCFFRCEEPVLIDDHIASVHLFRIAQESVSNAVRHGTAQRVEVTLARKGGTLLLQIRDDGKGLPQGWQKAAGLGLRIMRYRASVLEGSLQWHRAVPSGVIVRCSVPFGKKGGEP